MLYSIIKQNISQAITSSNRGTLYWIYIFTLFLKKISILICSRLHSFKGKVFTVRRRLTHSISLITFKTKLGATDVSVENKIKNIQPNKWRNGIENVFSIIHILTLIWNNQNEQFLITRNYLNLSSVYLSIRSVPYLATSQFMCSFQVKLKFRKTQQLSKRLVRFTIFFSYYSILSNSQNKSAIHTNSHNVAYCIVSRIFVFTEPKHIAFNRKIRVNCCFIADFYVKHCWFYTRLYYILWQQFKPFIWRDITFYANIMFECV